MPGGCNFDLRSMDQSARWANPGEDSHDSLREFGSSEIFPGRWRNQEHHQRVGAWWRLCLEVNSPRKNGDEKPSGFIFKCWKHTALRALLISRGTSQTPQLSSLGSPNQVTQLCHGQVSLIMFMLTGAKPYV